MGTPVMTNFRFFFRLGFTIICETDPRLSPLPLFTRWNCAETREESLPSPTSLAITFVEYGGSFI